MEEAWLERWDKRYRATEYAFGTQPNRYLEEQLRKFKPGTILFAAEGEGRNAVFAATQGWNAFAFDISSEGKKKAEQLAQKNKVHVDYQVGELPRLKYEANQFDA
ncbi:MAG TPA: SAM-dependent methyltransferase, partial [Cytophagales bacterium]|nr:SAM-dependent methyltransferase [Cytophagales bacterium]